MVLVREMLDVGGVIRNILFSASFIVCHAKFQRGLILRALTRGLAVAWFVRLCIIEGRIFFFY